MAEPFEALIEQSRRYLEELDTLAIGLVEQFRLNQQY